MSAVIIKINNISEGIDILKLSADAIKFYGDIKAIADVVAMKPPVPIPILDDEGKPVLDKDGKPEMESDESVRQMYLLQRSVLTELRNAKLLEITQAPPGLKIREKNFDFIPVYQQYPRKDGKTAGITRIKGQINTQVQFEKFTRAVQHYRDYHLSRGTDKQYIKMFSSFCSKDVWVDWVEQAPEHGDINKVSMPSFR